MTPPTPPLPPLFLSVISLNPRSTQARRDLASPYSLHQTLLRAFDRDGDPPDRRAGSERAGRLLFRLEADERDAARLPRVLVQSAAPPDWDRVASAHPDYFAPDPATGRLWEPPKDILGRLLSLPSGTPLRFRLRCNPTLSVAMPRADPQSPRPRGRRVALTSPDDQRAWISRHLAPAADLREVWLSPGDHLRVGRARDAAPPIQFRSVLADGLLVLRDPEAFASLVREGVGRATSLGHGLLSLAPA